MPVYPLLCPVCQTTEDVFLHHWYSPTPVCEVCSGPRERQVAPFSAPFSGSLHKYMDLKREGADRDGFWAYRQKSSISGQPEPVWLDSMEAVKAFNKAEGLSAPGDVPPNSTISSDGKRIESRGMPGQWVTSVPAIPSRLQEMISTPAEKCSPPPMNFSPCMPMDYGIRPEVTSAPPEVGG